MTVKGDSVVNSVLNNKLERESKWNKKSSTIEQAHSKLLQNPLAVSLIASLNPQSKNITSPNLSTLPTISTLGSKGCLENNTIFATSATTPLATSDAPLLATVATPSLTSGDTTEVTTVEISRSQKAAHLKKTIQNLNNLNKKNLLNDEIAIWEEKAKSLQVQGQYAQLLDQLKEDVF